MNSIWNKNYANFQTRFPQLAKILPPPDLTKLAQLPFWQLTTAKNGTITGIENGLRLHSAYNPEREAAGGIASSEAKEKSTTVFYGFGLGYHIIQWCNFFNHQNEEENQNHQKNITGDKNTNASPTTPKLVLIEPDPDHFYGALTILDWTPVFQLENLILAIGCPAETVLPLIEDTTKINMGNTGVSDACFFAIPAFMAHNQEYFKTVQSIINRNKRKNEINGATLKKFGKLWCRNSLKNMNKMRELGSVLDFIPVPQVSAHNIPASQVQTPQIQTPLVSAPQIPALIIGAGPSLSKILPHMAELKKRTIIIAVETSLRALLRIGVQPDIIIITDPQWWAYRHIAGLKSPESILVTEISTYPAVFRFPCKKIILCNSQFPVGQYIQEKLAIDLGDLGTGGSVASSAWNLAHLWGAKEIYTAGLDFSFPGNETHIRGSDAEETYLATATRLTGPDKNVAAGLYNANATQGKDYTGAPVMTDSRMKMFGWWFESRLAACPETKTYTLCPEGLQVPGITPAPLENLLRRPDITKEKEKFLAQQQPQNITGDKVPAFKKLMKAFPNKEFKEKFPFLEEYL